MASLNLSIHGPSIKSSYQGVISGPNLSSSSPTLAQWALFSVQAPLMNAFQDSGSRESVLKVETTGDGELFELIEDFNEGRIQFAFVKVKDPNTTLPKHVLIAWCGGGVPERTKGYFTSHLAAVSKVLHGYHVQITARSDNDVVPETIIQKVADASGAKYSSGDQGSAPPPAPPPVKSKPVFTPTTSSAGSGYPLVSARNKRDARVDDDGWGADAPQVTRTQLEKVESAYKPTRVNMAELVKQTGGASRPAVENRGGDGPGDVVGGGYQPVGKIDIAAIRAQAKTQHDDRPTTVKGAYEPVGKVDIAAIRAKSQRPAEDAPEARGLADRTAAFSQSSQSERLTSLPKPKVANKFGAASSFTGTKAPAPGSLGFGGPAVPTAAPVGAASRTFADKGGKTPAQLWAEKKAMGSNSGAGNTVSPPMASPLDAQKSGSEWKSGYSGKSWAVQTPTYNRNDIGQQKTGESDRSADTPGSSGGGVSALRDRFKNAAPIASAPVVPRSSTREPSPPPIATSTRPSGGFALPGLPARPPPPTDEDEDEEEVAPAQDYDEPEASPIRVAVPVSRATVIEPPEERLPPRPLPTREIERELPTEESLGGDEETHATARAAAAAVAEHSFGADRVAAAQASQDGGKKALIQYDYEKAEDNEIELREGEYLTNIEMVDDDWWMGTNSQGESGLFPSNYVELVEEDAHAAPTASAISVASRAAALVHEPEPEPEPEAAATSGSTATALFDYEAAEDNELSFAEGATVTNLAFPDEDWWFGHYGGKSGLFPANYVQLDS